LPLRFRLHSLPSAPYHFKMGALTTALRAQNPNFDPASLSSTIVA
jgi:hypothetical protein